MTVPINPSSPRNLTYVLVPNGSNYNPKLIWQKNPEPDVSGYDLHRWTSLDGWAKIATVNQPDTSYLDQQIVVSALGRDNTVSAEYYVQAFNNALTYSPGSNHDFVSYKIQFIPQPQSKSVAATIVPQGFAIEQNFPNPFNPDTEISFALPEPSSIRVTILDVLGRMVATLREGPSQLGFQTVRWDGRNVKGEAVSSGIYFCRLTAVGESGRTFSRTVKMTLAK